jgi:hypothetical protein
VRRLSPEQQVLWDRAQAVLAKPDSVDLYSLDPIPPGPGEEPTEFFQGWQVLGKNAVTDADGRKAVLAAAATIRPGWGAKCFNPRHGIRATAGEKTADLVNCFECRWVYVFLDREQEVVHLTIGRDQQPALDKVLTDAKVPLPRPAKE